MSWLYFYLLGYALSVEFDAMLCFALRRRYRIWGSLIVCLAWPITAFLAPPTIARWTKSMPPIGASKGGVA